MDQFGYFIIAGCVLMILPIIVVSWLQAGFFWSWARARAGRGSVVLIKARSPLRDYFLTGKVEEGDLIFKDTNKELKRVSLSEDVVYRCWGVPCVDFDSEKAAFVTHSFDKVTAVDPVKFMHLYVRALYRPGEVDLKQWLLIIVIIAGLGMFLAGAAAFVSFQTKQLVAAQGAQLATIIQQTAPPVVGVA